MVCPQGKGLRKIRFQILIGLPGQRKDEVHRYRLKRDRRQGRLHGCGIYGLSAQDFLILIAERLNPDADFRYTCIF